MLEQIIGFEAKDLVDGHLCSLLRSEFVGIASPVSRTVKKQPLYVGYIQHILSRCHRRARPIYKYILFTV